MPYLPHTLVSFGGDLLQLSGPSEQWNCTIRVLQLGASGGNAPVADLEAYLSAITPQVSAWFSAASSQMSPNSKLTYIKANNLGADGRYTGTTTHQRTMTINGGGTTQPVPAFCSLAYTWETGASRGFAHRGRMYPPNHSIPVQQGAQVTPANVATAVAQAKVFLTAVTQTNVAGPIVVSKHASEWRPITGVSVDNVYDVQRRRKHSVASTRTTGSWP